MIVVIPYPMEGKATPKSGFSLDWNKISCYLDMLNSSMESVLIHKHMLPKGSKPLKLKSQVISGYWVDPDGQIWSTKDPAHVRILATNVSGKSPYLKVGVMVNNKRVFVDMHRAVAESLLPRPKPKEIRRAIWQQMLASEKAFCWQAYEVNHKDHDRLNNHPDNLEWVCKRENLDKRNAHYY